MKERLILLLNELKFSADLEDDKIPDALDKPYNLTEQFIVKNQENIYIILLILQRYPNISAEWLLRGNGTMLLNEGTNSGDILSLKNNFQVLKQMLRQVVLKNEDLEFDGLMDKKDTQ